MCWDCCEFGECFSAHLDLSFGFCAIFPRDESKVSCNSSRLIRRKQTRHLKGQAQGSLVEVLAELPWLEAGDFATFEKMAWVRFALAHKMVRAVY